MEGRDMLITSAVFSVIGHAAPNPVTKQILQFSEVSFLLDPNQTDFRRLFSQKQ